MNIQSGKHFETLAKRYLVEQGCQIVTRNYRTRLGEIDIIALDNPYLVFVEVKYRQNKIFGGALASVTPTKQQRIIKTAQHYLVNNPSYAMMSGRFDVIAIDSQSQITWLKNAFTL